jgi:hypothetical protein
MTEPITRTELYWRVDNWFHEAHPDAPQQLSATDPAHQRWREQWIAGRDHMLNEEVNRVYWARYPEAPTQLDDSSPEWEKWRVSWMNIWHEVMDNAPEPGEVQLQNAVSNDGTLDLSHIKAAVREQLVDQQKGGMLLLDTFDDAVRLADELCEEVGAKAMAAGTVDGSWKSREDSVRGLGNEKVEIQVTGWWGDGFFTGAAAVTMSSLNS